MLKIQNSVDLKILKKFGFIYDKDNKFYRYNNENGSIHYVFENSRRISTTVDKYPNNYMIHDKIYELFEANLIEKV